MKDRTAPFSCLCGGTRLIQTDSERELQTDRQTDSKVGMMMLEGQKLTLIVHLQADKIDIGRQRATEPQTERQTDRQQGGHYDA